MQTNDEKKIANCPFCRSTAQLYIRNNQYTVRCNNHNCIAYDIEPHFISADSAISAWNASDRHTADVQEEMTQQEYEKKLFAMQGANAIMGDTIKSQEEEIEKLKDELERRKSNGAEQKNAEN